MGAPRPGLKIWNSMRSPVLFSWPECWDWHGLGRAGQVKRCPAHHHHSCKVICAAKLGGWTPNGFCRGEEMKNGGHFCTACCRECRERYNSCIGLYSLSLIPTPQKARHPDYWHSCFLLEFTSKFWDGLHTWMYSALRIFHIYIHFYMYCMHIRLLVYFSVLDNFYLNHIFCFCMEELAYARKKKSLIKRSEFLTFLHP